VSECITQTCDFDAKMQNFSGEGADTPPPRRLDLNPSHSKILPTLLHERPKSSFGRNFATYAPITSSTENNVPFQGRLCLLCFVLQFSSMKCLVVIANPNCTTTLLMSSLDCSKERVFQLTDTFFLNVHNQHSVSYTV